MQSFRKPINPNRGNNQKGKIFFYTYRMKKKKQINVNGFGLKQLRLLQRMFKDDLVIRIITDHDSRTIELQDDSGDNSYESVPFQLFNSLGKRNLFSYFGWMPALFVTIDTFKIKREVIELLGWQKEDECVCGCLDPFAGYMKCPLHDDKIELQKC